MKEKGGTRGIVREEILKVVGGKGFGGGSRDC